MAMEPGRVGYTNMGIKFVDPDFTAYQFQDMKALLVCCEMSSKTNGRKIWLGTYVSMAMAAHALDLIAEAFPWMQTPLHYERSELLRRKAEELVADLGDNYNFGDKKFRDKIVAHATNYASLFPCSDAWHILWQCYSDEGDRIIILIEKPYLSEDSFYQSDDRYYGLKECSIITEPFKQNKRNLLVEPKPYSKKMELGPYDVLGTNELQRELGVEPDLVSRSLVGVPGASNTPPYIYQQWTWCPRMMDPTRTDYERDMHLRGSRPKGKAYPDFSSTTFHHCAFRTSGSSDVHFQMLNNLVYDHINHSRTKRFRKQTIPTSFAQMLDYSSYFFNMMEHIPPDMENPLTDVPP